MAAVFVTHIARPAPSWRQRPTLTECGADLRRVTAQIDGDAVRGKVKVREGRQQTPDGSYLYTSVYEHVTGVRLCQTCADAWSRHSQLPKLTVINILRREIEVENRRSLDSDATPLDHELQAIEMLIAAHAAEFDETLQRIQVMARTERVMGAKKSA